MNSEWRKDKIINEEFKVCCKSQKRKEKKLNVGIGSQQLHPFHPLSLPFWCVDQADMWGAKASLPLSPSRLGVSTRGHHLNESDTSLSTEERSPAVQPNASEAGT